MKYLFLLSFAALLLSTRSAAQAPDSLDLKIGQMIMFGFYGTSAGKPMLKEIKAGRVGGILVYERNLAAKNTAATLLQLMQAFQKDAPISLFTSIDHEGGLVNRLKTKYGFPPLPSAEYFGRLNNTDTTKRYIDDACKTLNSIGLNLNYAPVLDVKNASNPVLGARERCYSSDVDIIVAHAAETIRSHRQHSIATTVKHFPGHGNSSTDSHFGVADVTRTWKPEELEPYSRLIDSGLVDAVLTAHIVNQQLDPSGLPGTLSKKMITGLLRNDLHFNGVVFSDDMQMQAISKQFGFEEGIRLAIEAGVDVLMFSNNIQGVGATTPAKVHAIIKKLVVKGKVPAARITESYNRIMALKAAKRIDNQPNTLLSGN